MRRGTSKRLQMSIRHVLYVVALILRHYRDRAEWRLRSVPQTAEKPVEERDRTRAETNEMLTREQRPFLGSMSLVVVCMKSMKVSPDRNDNTELCLLHIEIAKRSITGHQPCSACQQTNKTV